MIDISRKSGAAHAVATVTARTGRPGGHHLVICPVDARATRLWDTTPRWRCSSQGTDIGRLARHHVPASCFRHHRRSYV